MVTRTQSQIVSAVEADDTTVAASDDAQVSDDDVRLLFELAPLVGERGAPAAERVLRQLANGNGRALRAELNRLAAKFVASLEP